MAAMSTEEWNALDTEVRDRLVDDFYAEAAWLVSEQPGLFAGAGIPPREDKEETSTR